MRRLPRTADFHWALLGYGNVTDSPLNKPHIAGASRLTQNICKTSLTTNRLWRRRRRRWQSYVDCIITEQSLLRWRSERPTHDHLPPLLEQLWGQLQFVYISRSRCLCLCCAVSAVKIAVKSPAIRLIFDNKKLLTVNHAQTSTSVLALFFSSWSLGPARSSWYYYDYFWNPVPPEIIILAGLIGFCLHCLRRCFATRLCPRLRLRSLIWVYGFPLVFCVTLMPSSANANARQTNRASDRAGAGAESGTGSTSRPRSHPTPRRTFNVLLICSNKLGRVHAGKNVTWIWRRILPENLRLKYMLNSLK